MAAAEDKRELPPPPTDSSCDSLAALVLDVGPPTDKSSTDNPPTDKSSTDNPPTATPATVVPPTVPEEPKAKRRNPFLNDPKFEQFEEQKRDGLNGYISPAKVLKAEEKDDNWKWGKSAVAVAQRVKIRSQVQAERLKIHYRIKNLEAEDRRLINILTSMRQDEAEES